jgi:transaldolase
MRGIERRLEAKLSPVVHSVASLFVSRWDVAVADKVTPALRNSLGIAVAQQTYAAYRNLLDSPRWKRLLAAGAAPQRMLWASTGTKDPAASDLLYIRALAAPNTINTMPEPTLQALADHGQIDAMMDPSGGDCEDRLAQFRQAGIDLAALATKLQEDGAKSFTKSWNDLLDHIASKKITKKAG